MALMPVSGDVDCVLASELAEAGRATQRGLVTPDRTTLTLPRTVPMPSARRARWAGRRSYGTAR